MRPRQWGHGNKKAICTRMRIFLWISSFPAQAYKLVLNRKWFIVLQTCKMRRVICFYYWHTSVGLHEFYCLRGFIYWLSFQTSVFTTWKYSVEQSSRRAVEFLSYATPSKTAVPLVGSTTTEQHPFDVQPLTWKKSVLPFDVCDTAKSPKKIEPQLICVFFTEACKMNGQQSSKYNVAIVAPRKIASVGEGSQLEGVTRYGLRGHILRVFWCSEGMGALPYTFLIRNWLGFYRTIKGFSRFPGGAMVYTPDLAYVGDIMLTNNNAGRCKAYLVLLVAISM